MLQAEPPDPGNQGTNRNRPDIGLDTNSDVMEVTTSKFNCEAPSGFWNAQGAWSKGFRRACRYILNQFQTDVLALLEPQIVGSVCDSLGFSNNYCVEAVGASGGVWLLWNESNTILQVTDDTTHFIHAKIDVLRFSYHLIMVYGPPSPARRVQFWEELENTVASINDPLFIGGDFNVIVSLDERCGGTGGLMADSDMGFSGSNSLGVGILDEYFGPAASSSHIFFTDAIILMAEASESQMRIIMDMLDRFCKATIFVSVNVDQNMISRLQNVSGMMVSADMGSYLGMSVLQKHVNKDTFSNLLTKARKKLLG
ncbi:hypothetical protein V2J09_001038 [Rumex salicifolius]